MIKNLILMLHLVLITSVAWSQNRISATKEPPRQNTEGHCATDGLHSKLLQESSSYSKNFNEMNTRWQTYALEKNPVGGKVKGGSNSTQTYTNTTLPVIFHMMVNTLVSSLNPNASATDGNLTKTQIQNALAILNQIYAGTATGSKPAGLNTDIQFCLAEVDNYGNAITSYTYTDPSFSLTLSNTNQSQITALSNIVQSTGKFPPTKYINVYVVEDISSPVAGFAYMPPAHGSSFDGIYIEAQYLLNPGPPNDLPYNMTVMAHEMGHYLGLFHTFGICTNIFYACSCNNNNCLFDGDMVCDTPPDFSQSSVTCTTVVNTCTTDVAAMGDALNPTTDGPDLISNYMDYGNWNCQFLFTQGQINRMHFMIDDQVGPRNSLLNSSVCNTVCANSACTIAINPITTTSVNSVQLLNSLILSGPSVNYNFSGTTCSPFYNTFNWAILNATTNATLATGSGATYNATFTAVGNYKVVLMSSISGSSPLCFQTATLNVQVLPPVSCPANLDMNAGWNAGNWERVYYEGGWAHTSNNSPTFIHPTTTLTILPGGAPNGTTPSDPFSFTNTVSGDPNFPGASSVPFPGATIMRVGRLITPTTVLPAGDGNYVTYTFSPTNANAKIRVWYLGLKEKDISPIAYDNSFATPSQGRTGFGWVCSYNFTAPFTPVVTGNRGLTHTGVNNSIFRVNDMISDGFNYPSGITSTLAIGTATYDAMNNWQYMDLDFSEFVCAAPTITLTFFARADEASTPGFLHSYAYFATQCLPGLYKDIDIKLDNKDIGCMANVGQSCTKIVLPPPNPYSASANGAIYPFLFDVDIEESNNGVTYTPVSLGYGIQYNYSTSQYDLTYNLCKSPDTNPYKYFRITYRTLCQTITNTLSIYQGFVHTIDDCAPAPMSGGHFTATPVTSGTITYNPDQYHQICSSTTLALGRPCWLTVSDPDPAYQWEINLGGWGPVAGATMATLPLTNTPAYYPCTQYRRQAKYTDPYCNTDIWIASDIFNVTNFTYNFFNYVVSGPDVCGNSLTTFSINNLYEYPNFLCDQELAAQTATAPVTNSITISFFSNSACTPATSLTANSGPSVFTYTYLNSTLNSLNDIDLAFTFNNISTYTATGYAYALVQVNRFGCNSSFTIPILIKIKPSAIPGTIASPTTICTSSTFTITGDNPNSTGYYWEYSYSPTFVPTLTVSAATSSILPVTPATFTGFPVYVRRVANGTVVCPNVAYSNTVTLINTAPSITVTPSSATICAGQTVTLTASGASSYTWTNGTATTSANPLTLTPMSTKVYTITGINAYGCTDTQTGTITVLPSPTLSIEGSSSTKLCSGTTATYNASGATSYTWVSPSGSSTINPLVVTPTVNTTYTLIGSNGTCTSTLTIPVTVFPTPTINISPSSSTICAGISETLTASGATSYTWFSSPTTSTTTNPYVVTPTATTVYTVTGYVQNTGCWGMNTVTITVLPSPTAAISGNTVICYECNVFTASGGGTYLWSNGSTNPTVCINGSGPLSVTVTGVNGCTSVSTITTVASSVPSMTAGATPSLICIGNCATLTAGGGVTTVTWTAPSYTSYANPSVVCPTVTTNYTITGAKGTGPCTNSAVITVSVDAPSTLTITGNTFICGSCTTLTATGASTYTWSTGATTSTVCISMPGTYTVNGTNAAGCVSTKTINVVWGTWPSVSANVAPNPICPGANATLTAAGALTYTWTSTAASFTSYSNPVVVNPTVTTTYTVFGRGGKNSCTSSTVVTVNVNPAPVASITGWINGCSSFNTTLTASGGGTYLWNTGQTTNTLAVSGIYSTIYTCTVTGVNGCTNVATANIIVNPSNTISITGNPNICSGQTATLSASGGFSWIWSTGATTSVITTNMSGVYTVTANLGHGCKSIASVTVNVLANPTANITGNLIICNNTTTLTATGGGTYLWNTGATTNTIAVSVVGVYGVTVTAPNGCTATKTVQVVTQHGCVLNGKLAGTNPEPVLLADPFIFPNPTNQSFSIGNSEGVISVEVFDYTGKLVKYVSRENASFNNIDMRQFDNGLYMIRVTRSKEDRRLFKLIKE